MAGGATYNPGEHTTSNKSYGVASVPIDARSYYTDLTLFIMRPYQSLVEALGYLDTAPKRTGHFSVFIHTGTLEPDGSFSGGELLEYWFKAGTADADLVNKLAPDPFTTVDTYADMLAHESEGLFKVLASESNNGEKSFYIKDGSDVFWLPIQKIEPEVLP